MKYTYEVTHGTGPGGRGVGEQFTLNRELDPKTYRNKLKLVKTESEAPVEEAPEVTEAPVEEVAEAPAEEAPAPAPEKKPAAKKPATRARRKPAAKKTAK